jgi:hypothetical protein
MPLGEGWWLNLDTGEAISIYEHASEVTSNPKKFRLKPADVKGFISHDPEHRRELLKKVMRKGFGRIRESKSFLVFEFDYSFDDAMVRLIDFLRDKGYGEYATIQVHSLRDPSKNFSSTVGGLLDMRKTERLPGYKGKLAIPVSTPGEVHFSLHDSKVRLALSLLHEALRGPSRKR